MAKWDLFKKYFEKLQILVNFDQKCILKGDPTSSHFWVDRFILISTGQSQMLF